MSGAALNFSVRNLGALPAMRMPLKGITLLPVVSRLVVHLTAGPKPVLTPWTLTAASQAYCGMANSWNCSASYNAARHMLQGEHERYASWCRPLALCMCYGCFLSVC